MCGSEASARTRKCATETPRPREACSRKRRRCGTQCCDPEPLAGTADVQDYRRQAWRGRQTSSLAAVHICGAGQGFHGKKTNLNIRIIRTRATLGPETCTSSANPAFPGAGGQTRAHLRFNTASSWTNPKCILNPNGNVVRHASATVDLMSAGFDRRRPNVVTIRNRERRNEDPLQTRTHARAAPPQSGKRKMPTCYRAHRMRPPHRKRGRNFAGGGGRREKSKDQVSGTRCEPALLRILMRSAGMSEAPSSKKGGAGRAHLRPVSAPQSSDLGKSREPDPPWTSTSNSATSGRTD